MTNVEQVEERNCAAESSGRKSFNWGCLILSIIVGLTLLGMLVALLLPARCVAREAARRAGCRNNLKQIALALLNYEQAYKCFPPAHTVDEHGKAMHSWRVLILPFLEYEVDAEKYDFSQPWNNPANIAFANKSRAREVFRCPNEFMDDPQCETSYVMLVGQHAFGDGATPRRLSDITDEYGKTIMLGEMSRSGILWTEPRDLNVEEMSSKLNDPEKPGLRSEHSGGLHVGFCDGSVRFIINVIDPKCLKALTTIDGGEDMKEYNDCDW